MVSRAEVFANLATEQRWVIQQDRTMRWRQLAWLSCNFKLTLGNLDTLTVSHIDAVTLPGPGMFREVGIIVSGMAAKGFQDVAQAGTMVPAKIGYYRPNLTPLATLACSARVVSIGTVPLSPSYLTKVPVG